MIHSVVDVAVDCVKRFIEAYDWSVQMPRKRRRYDEEPVDLWQTSWGRMLRDPDILDPYSRVSKKFQRRFRCPFLLFRDVLVPLCLEHGVFGERAVIPVEFKILVSLRILGRGNCSDDISELSGVGESTVNFIFKTFCLNFGKLLNEFVRFPEGDDLKCVQMQYAKMGLPLACGSMDVTHVRLGKCPYFLSNHCTGKENYPSLAFQAICGPNKELFHVSEAFLGALNDNTITHNDTVTNKIKMDFLMKKECIQLNYKAQTTTTMQLCLIAMIKEDMALVVQVWRMTLVAALTYPLVSVPKIIGS